MYNMWKYKINKSHSIKDKKIKQNYSAVHLKFNIKCYYIEPMKLGGDIL